jgi:uncharacterized membrane protein
MKTTRLDAFSDGIIAVISTIMVLDLRPPHEATLAGLAAMMPDFLVYALSFLMVAIMWINHHQYFLHARTATTGLIWSNAFLLFWMSLIPFVTAWLGDHPLAPLPLLAYSADMVLSTVGFLLIQSAITCQVREDETLKCIFDRDRLKAAIALVLYAAAGLLAWWSPYPAIAIFVLIPLAYFWPDPKAQPVGE